MICGAKWKSCDCPWFNYAAVEHDRLLHLNVAQARVEGLRADGMPRAYHEELERRRTQERDDEAFARRMQGLDIGNNTDHNNNYPGGVFAVGNAAGHFLNEHFVQRATNILTANYGPNQADATNRILAETGPPPPPPAMMLRQRSTASRRYNSVQQPRAVERPGSRRVVTDHTSETAGLSPSVPVMCEPVRRVGDARRHSAMAGLTRSTPEGRVDEWRRHVEDDGSVPVV